MVGLLIQYFKSIIILLNKPDKCQAHYYVKKKLKHFELNQNQYFFDKFIINVKKII